MMRWVFLVVVGIAAMAGTAYFVFHASAPPPVKSSPLADEATETQRQIQAMKSFDAKAYARAAMDKGDFRPVIISSAWHAEVPGIDCVAEHSDSRRGGFGDVIFEGYDDLLRQVKDAARRFNRTLTTDPRYPDKDICFPSDQSVTMAEAIETTRELIRQPKIVDLHTAVRARDIEAVRRQIASGADVNAVDQWRSTPLMWAMRRKDRVIAAELIAAGADVYKHSIGDSALVVALETGDASLVRDLLVVGTKPTPATPTPKGWRGSTNTHALAALYQERFDLLELLLAFEAVPLRNDAQSWDLILDQARRSGCTRCIDAMLAYGGVELAASGALESQVHEALVDNASTMLVRLVRPVIDRIAFSAVARDALQAAVDNDRSNALRLLLKGNVAYEPQLLRKGAHDVNLLAPGEAATLYEASAVGDEPAIKAALAIAAGRRSTLDDAIRAGNILAIRAAIPRGATLKQTNTITPLMSAAKTASPPVIETLIKGGAIVNARVRSEMNHYPPGPDHGETALYFAFEGANVDAARVLLRHGADLDAKTDAWPLLIGFARHLENASLETKQRVVNLVFEAPPRERRTVRLNTMLVSAVNWARWSGADLVDILLLRGADPCAKAEYFRTAIASAAAGDDFTLFERLVDHCPDWSPTSPAAREALKEALDDPFLGFDEEKQGRTKIIRFLLEQKTPLPPAPFGVAKLCDALSYGNNEVAGLLIEAGIDINQINNDQTALDCVRGASKTETERIKADLSRRGGKTAIALGHTPKQWPFPF